jgi:hypothetical protein
MHTRVSGRLRERSAVSAYDHLIVAWPGLTVGVIAWAILGVRDWWRSGTRLARLPSYVLSIGSMGK